MVRIEKTTTTSPSTLENIAGKYENTNAIYFICRNNEVIQKNVKLGDKISKIFYQDETKDLNHVISEIRPFGHFGKKAYYVGLRAEQALPL